jgi:hypothetical protein
MRLRVMLLSEISIKIRPTGIEIAEGRVIKSVSISIIVKHTLDHELGSPIWIDRMLLGRLGDRQRLLLAGVTADIPGATRRGYLYQRGFDTASIGRLQSNVVPQIHQ